MILVIYVPLAYFLLKNKPEDIGLLPDNHQKENQETKSNQLYDISWTLKEAMKTRQLWLILFCVSIPSMINTGLTFHLLSILSGTGLTATTAALILSLMVIVGFPVTLLSGFILEKIKVNIVLASLFLGQLIFLTILYFTQSFSVAILFGVIWGIVGGIERITISFIFPEYFGRKYLGSIKGIAMTVTVIGSAFGPLPFGIAYDLFGGYQEIILLMMAFPFLGVVASLLSPRPVKKGLIQYRED